MTYPAQYAAALSPVRYAAGRPPRPHPAARGTGWDDLLAGLHRTLPDGHHMRPHAGRSLADLHQPSLEAVQQWAGDVLADDGHPDAAYFNLGRGRRGEWGRPLDGLHLSQLAEAADGIKRLKLEKGLPLDETGYDAGRDRRRDDADDEPAGPVAYAAALSPVRYGTIGHDEFLKAIEAAPRDDAARGAYADWLEERELADPHTLAAIRHGPSAVRLHGGRPVAVFAARHPDVDRRAALDHPARHHHVGDYDVHDVDDETGHPTVRPHAVWLRTAGVRVPGLPEPIPVVSWAAGDEHGVWDEGDWYTDPDAAHADAVRHLRESGGLDDE